MRRGDPSLIAIPHKMPVEKITFGKDNLTGYIVGEVNNPAVIVIQEWWGINDVSTCTDFLRVDVFPIVDDLPCK